MKPWICALVLLLTVVPAEAREPAPIAGQGYVLVKNWDFGEVIKTERDLYREFYTRYVYSGGQLDFLKGNDEWQRYRENGNHRLTAHSLHLIARADHGLVKGAITSGMLRSKWTGKYGYFECRMRVPKGRALWSACWLNPEDQRWPPEIDIVELLDNGRDTTRRSFHGINPGKSDVMDVRYSKLSRWNGYEPGFDYADGYHVFAVAWTPTFVRHYVDDVLVAERTLSWKHDDGSDGGPAHFLVNLAVGGKWPGAPTDPSVFPAILDIDYIRVWQKP